MGFTIDALRILFAGYVVCFFFLNLVAYMISLFYNRKIQQKSPRSGFLGAMFCMFFLVPLIFVKEMPDYLAIIELLLVLGGCFSCIWNSVAMFITMKQRQD